MNRVEEILKDLSVIKLDKEKDIKIRLLQFRINELLFKFKNKYAFNLTIIRLVNELKQLIHNQTITDELKSNIKLIAQRLQDYHDNYNPTIKDITNAVDNSCKYILFQYVKNKDTYNIHQLIYLNIEIKELIEIINTYNIEHTSRINNFFKLKEQVKERIISIL